MFILLSKLVNRLLLLMRRRKKSNEKRFQENKAFENKA